MRGTPASGVEPPTLSRPVTEEWQHDCPPCSSYTQEAMNNSSKLCRKTSFPRSNIFCNLVDKIVKRPSLQFLGQWGYHCYEPRIYRTLAKILRYVDLDGFDILLTDYIAFVEKSGHRFELNFNLEFTEICVNTILYWVFARKGNPDFVELLLKKTKDYVQDRSCSLALICSMSNLMLCPERGVSGRGQGCLLSSACEVGMCHWVLPVVRTIKSCWICSRKAMLANAWKIP